MKVVWGKGDKLHVLDNFNADDYSDFIIPDYLDRRISTPMVRAVYSLPLANMNLEGVYTPLLPVDRFATSGRWTPAQVGALTGTVTMAAEENIGQLVTACEEARTGLAAATTLATSSEAQAKAAQEAAAAYAAQIADYTAKITQTKTTLATMGSSLTPEQKEELNSKIQQATISLVHCTAEKTAQGSSQM